MSEDGLAGAAAQDAAGHGGTGVLRQPLRQRLRERPAGLAGRGGPRRARASAPASHDRHPGPQLLLQRRGGPRQGAALAPRSTTSRVRTDRAIGRLLETIDRQVGLARTLVVADRRPRGRAGPRADEGVEDARGPILPRGARGIGDTPRSRPRSVRGRGWKAGPGARST